MWTRIRPGDPAVEVDGLHELHERDEDRLVGDEHAEQQQGEDDLGAAEAPLGEHVAVEGAEDRRSDRGRDGQQQAVDEVGAQRGEGRTEVVEVQPRGQLPHRGEVDLLEGLQAGDQHHVDRQQVEDGHEAEEHQGQGP
jgi:hypothetical protein